MKRFYIYPDILFPGNPRYNVIDPVEDVVPGYGTEDQDEKYKENESVGVEILTDSGSWDSVATIKDEYTDEYGSLLIVEVDWGRATLLSSDS